MAVSLSEKEIRVEVRNIGGIDETSVTLPPGVSVLTGENATNRTSFLTALMAALGSNRASLKRDADEGAVTLDIGGQEYGRTLRRRNGTVTFEGDPYLDDPELADLFAFLLEDNEARRTIARGDDLREMIMRPVDTDRIDAEIEACKREREEIETEIERLDRLEKELPELEAERREKRTELESAKEDLTAVQDEIESLDTGVERSRSQKEKLEKAFQRVRDARSELDDLEFDLETERSSLAELEAEREDLEETLADAEEPTESPERLAGRVQELRERKQTLDTTINELGSVINFNEEMLEEEGLDIDGTVEGETPIDKLTADTEIACWTCGSEVSTDQIDENPRPAQEPPVGETRRAPRDPVADSGALEQTVGTPGGTAGDRADGRPARRRRSGDRDDPRAHRRSRRARRDTTVGDNGARSRGRSDRGRRSRGGTRVTPRVERTRTPSGADRIRPRGPRINDRRPGSGDRGARGAGSGPRRDRGAAHRPPDPYRAA